MRYLLIDTANLFFRASHITSTTSLQERIAFAIHIALTSVAKSWRDFQANHVIFCLEGRSWRKDFYPPYKRNRAEERGARSQKEVDEDAAFWAAFDSLVQFLKDQTNCTVLQLPNCEADDLIGYWVDQHPEDQHCIVSTDSDFDQLIANNVCRFNGVSGELITLKGFFDWKKKPILDKKTKLPKLLDEPEYILFEKCIRGDSSDNVFSAYPRARENGTKNRTGIRQAYADRHTKGFAWNNFMLQRWSDHNEVEHRVLDDYERNRILIDLRSQPAEIKADMARLFSELDAKNVSMIGAKFLRLCGRFELIKLSEEASKYADILSAAYLNLHSK